jgi:hypothetical protein
MANNHYATEKGKETVPASSRYSMVVGKEKRPSLHGAQGNPTVRLDLINFW